MHLIATNFYGGPEKQIVEHLRRLNDRQYRGLFVSFDEGRSPNEAMERARTFGLDHRSVPMSCALDCRALWKLTRLLRDEGVGLLCTHGYKSTVMGWWAGNIARIPVIAFSRGYTSENLKVAFYERIERCVLNRLAGVVCVSEGQKRYLVSLGLRNKLTWVVHNAVSSETFTHGTRDTRKSVCRRLGLENDSQLVVSAGRLSPEKGHRVLIDAIAKMGNENSSVYFVFCGEGPCKNDLVELAKALDVTDQCRFVGFRHDLIEIFQAMDLMVLPSMTEGLPNVILEAFACAKPVVATNVGGVPEVLENGINGKLVPPGRAEVLAEAISRCLRNPELMRTMGRAGYSKVKAEFSFESQTRQLEAIYNEVLSYR